MSEGRGVLELLRGELSSVSEELVGVLGELVTLAARRDDLVLRGRQLEGLIELLPTVGAATSPPRTTSPPSERVVLPSTAPPNSPRRKQPTWRTAERDEVLRRMYAAGDQVGDIMRALTALPGGDVPEWSRVSAVAAVNMKLHRPDGYTWDRTKRATSTARPTSWVATEKLDASQDAAISGGDFRRQLNATLPALKGYALKLTRDSDRADDLMQQTAVLALSGERGYVDGSSLVSWLSTIMRNAHFSAYRKTHREVEDVDGEHAAGLTTQPDQLSHLETEEVVAAFGRLSPEHQEALVSVRLDGQTYEEAAEAADVAVGTMKSRVNRATDALERERENAPRQPKSRLEALLAVSAAIDERRVPAAVKNQ